MANDWRMTMAARLVALLLLGGASLLQAAPADGPLARVAPGAWELREAGGAPRRLCIADPVRLLSVQRPGAACNPTLLERADGALTVSYACAGLGRGRSTLTAHTAGAFRLHTQGIAAGAPFDREIAGRRMGDCVARETNKL